MSWDDSLRELRKEETPMVFLSSLLSQIDLADEDMIQIAEAMLVGGDYELEFLYSFTAHMADLVGDIEEMQKTMETPVEFSIDELLHRTLQKMGVNGL
jgi:hypothetical protein